MPFIVQFILTLATTTIVVSGASLLWPKFTRNPSPEPLTKVREVVLQTDVGKQAAQILGVSDTQPVEPVNVSSVAGVVVSNVLTNVQEQVQDAATREIIIQVVKKLKPFNRNSRKK